MEFNLIKTTNLTVDVDFQKLFNIVSKDLEIEEFDENALDEIYTNFGNNLGYYMEKYFKDNTYIDPKELEDIIYDDINENELDFIWDEFGEWMNENYKTF